MLVIGKEPGALEFCGSPTNDLLVLKQFSDLPWLGADNDQCIRGEGIQPLTKTVNNGFPLVNYGPQELCKLQTATKYNLIVPCLTVLARYEAKYVNVPSEAGRMSPSWDVSLFERQNWIKLFSPDT